MNEILSTANIEIPLPKRLTGLRRLAYNLYWSWNEDVQTLFQKIDSQVWFQTANPVMVLESIKSWDRHLENPEFMADYEAVLERFDHYMSPTTEHWFSQQNEEFRKTFEKPVAYFCAEYGLHESVKLYSGGLGILAGDHLKSVSDLGLPMVAVGLFYRQGYFRQTIDADGHQEHAYPYVDPAHLPMERVLDPESGRPLLVQIQIGQAEVYCVVRKVQVGRVPLLILDADIPENARHHRSITTQLYVRGREMRLHQEIMLGVAGVRALNRLGLEPSVWHLNEGHSAFMLVERLRQLRVSGLSADEAARAVRSKSVFTIHTPVSAGNERFDSGLVRQLCAAMLSQSGLDIETVLEQGRGADERHDIFDMTAFSLRHSRRANAVSQLHGETANATWTALGQKILGLTNGVHMPTWLGPSQRKLLEENGANFRDPHQAQERPPVWERIHELDDAHLWAAHISQKKRLSHFVRGRLQNQFARHGESPTFLKDLTHALDSKVLTIGFARRFATYKRAALIFSDPERLSRLIWNKERPVQLLFAGKAHPADRPGQEMIRQIFAASQSERFRERIFILEDYDMQVGRFMVQGADIWLNNPRRPLEASGTSGMKAAANGVLNCSVLDGWWDEGFAHDNGWAIGSRDVDSNEQAQDHHDAESLYRLLEEEIIPTYYHRDSNGVPTDWVHKMKRSMETSLWTFSMSRVVQEYAEKMYHPEG
jgi:glycogen phosphorylase